MGRRLGLAHADHVDVIGVDGGVHLGTQQEHVLHRFGWRDRLTARVVWPAPARDVE